MKKNGVNIGSVTVSNSSGNKYHQRVSVGDQTISCAADHPAAPSYGLKPAQLVLGGLGGCIAGRIRDLAEQKRWDIQEITIRVSETEEPAPKSTRKKRIVLRVELEVEGNLSPLQLRRIKATARNSRVYRLLTGSKRLQTAVRQIPRSIPASGWIEDRNTLVAQIGGRTFRIVVTDRSGPYDMFSEVAELFVVDPDGRQKLLGSKEYNPYYGKSEILASLKMLAEAFE